MLTFNLKKEWFDKIKSGEKTHEYREAKPYWKKRIHKAWCMPFARICFCCGYPSKKDDDKRIIAKMKSTGIINGKNTDLAIDKPAYDIEFEVIKE